MKEEKNGGWPIAWLLALLVVIYLLAAQISKCSAQPVVLFGASTTMMATGRMSDFTLGLPAEAPFASEALLPPVSLEATGPARHAPLSLPSDPSGLGAEWEDVTPPERRHLGDYREFRNRKSGEHVRFDRGDNLGQPPHWHRYNPDPLTKIKYPYISASGQLCTRKCGPSHIYPSVFAPNPSKMCTP